MNFTIPNNSKWIIANKATGKVGKREYIFKASALKKAAQYGENAVVLPTLPKFVPQYARLAYALLKVNPDYVTDPANFITYIKGPNWDEPDCNFAHYAMTVKLYGEELFDLLSHIRILPYEEAVADMTDLVKAIGIRPE